MTVAARYVAARYARVSTGMQSKSGASLPAQDRGTAEHCARNGYLAPPEHFYVDVDSGSDSDRPHLARLMEAVKRREVQVVVVNELDRWVRDDDFRGHLSWELRTYGCRLEFVLANYDTRTSGGRLQMAFDSNMAQEELNKNSSRSRRVYDERLKQGKLPMQGQAPYGYQKEGEWIDTVDGPRWIGTGQLLIDEAEARVIRSVFSMCAGGMSANSIRKQLNRDGILPPSANGTKNYGRRADAWATAVLNSILRDPVYKGTRVVRRLKSIAVDQEAKFARAQNGQKPVNAVVRPKAEWVYIPGVPAIIEEEEWNRCQEVLSSRCGARARNETRPALCRGIARCECGAALQPEFSKAGVLGYRCSSRLTAKGSCGGGNTGKRTGRTGRTVPGPVLDSQTWRIVAAFLSDPIKAAHDIAQLTPDGPGRAVTDALARCKKGIAALDKKISKWVEHLGDTELPTEVIKAHLADAHKEKARLTQEMAVYEWQIAEHAALQQRLHSLEEWCLNRAIGLSEAGFDERRKVLLDLGIKIVARRPTRDNPSAIVSITAAVPLKLVEEFKERAQGQPELDREVSEALAAIGPDVPEEPDVASSCPSTRSNNLRFVVPLPTNLAA